MSMESQANAGLPAVRKNSEAITYLSSHIVIQTIVPNASLPTKREGYDTDVTFNITLIERKEARAEDYVNDINSFNTGLIINPPQGYYIEVVGNPLLHKHGYFLPSVQIINPQNDKELIVDLFKFKDTDDLPIPFDAVFMILKPSFYAHIYQDVKKVKSSSSFGNPRKAFATRRTPQFEEFDEDEEDQQPVYKIKKPVTKGKKKSMF
jgi:hypothetical protein